MSALGTTGRSTARESPVVTGRPVAARATARRTRIDLNAHRRYVVGHCAKERAVVTTSIDYVISRRQVREEFSNQPFGYPGWREVPVRVQAIVSGCRR